MEEEVKAVDGNTSTDVEKTFEIDRGHQQQKKHLHGRGEDWRTIIIGWLFSRNTSTDVEKTVTHNTSTTTHWKHLHGRGEDRNTPLMMVRHLETPPRTWRRLLLSLSLFLVLGNTSTDVEKTNRKTRTIRMLKKHLHGRGEDCRKLKDDRFAVETPPRTWRRPQTQRLDQTGSRNTSTDVEKTLCCSTFRRCRRKHLHGRGEDPVTSTLFLNVLETPPRTWRRPLYNITFGTPFGNTSTDVEKTARFGIKSL